MSEEIIKLFEDCNIYMCRECSKHCIVIVPETTEEPNDPCLYEGTWNVNKTALWKRFLINQTIGLTREACEENRKKE